MAKFETVPIGELETRLPAKLLPLVEEYRERFEKLQADQGGRLVLEKGDDPKDLRKALKAAAGALNRRVRFPFRGGGGLAELLPGENRGGGGPAQRPTCPPRGVGRGGGRRRRAADVVVSRRG